MNLWLQMMWNNNNPSATQKELAGRWSRNTSFAYNRQQKLVCFRLTDFIRLGLHCGTAWPWTI